MMNDSKSSENIYIPVVRFRFLSTTSTGTVHRRVDVRALTHGGRTFVFWRTGNRYCRKRYEYGTRYEPRLCSFVFDARTF